MKMYVIGDPRPSRDALIDPNIETGWGYHVPQDANRPLGKGHELRHDLRREIVYTGSMRVGHYHQVTIIIGVTIEHDETGLPAPDNKVLGIIIRGERRAKDAAHRFRSLDIL